MMKIFLRQGWHSTSTHSSHCHCTLLQHSLWRVVSCVTPFKHFYLTQDQCFTSVCSGLNDGPPQIHVLFPRTCEYYLILQKDKCCFIQQVTCLRRWREACSGLAGWAWNVITCILVRDSGSFQTETWRWCDHEGRESGMIWPQDKEHLEPPEDGVQPCQQLYYKILSQSSNPVLGNWDSSIC